MGGIGYKAFLCIDVLAYRGQQRIQRMHQGAYLARHGVDSQRRQIQRRASFHFTRRRASGARPAPVAAHTTSVISTTSTECGSSVSIRIFFHRLARFAISRDT